MKKATKWIVIILGFLSATAFSADKSVDLGTVVFSPTRLSESKYSAGKSVDVLTSSDLEESGYARIADNLETLPGVIVKQADGLGGLTTIRIRGLRSIDTKVTLNGLPFRDPSDPQGSANPFYQDLDSTGIGRIEVTRGVGSTLWGSDAQGGVIALYTEKGKGDPRVNGGFEFGSFGTFREYLEFQGEKWDTDAYVRVGQLNSDGISIHDWSSNTSVSSKVGHTFESGARIEAIYVGYKASASLRNSPQILDGVLFNDSPSDHSRRENEVADITLHLLIPVGENINWSSRTGFLDSDRRFNFILNDDGSGFENDGGFEGQDLIFDNQADFIHNEILTSTVGWQHEVEWQTIRAKLLPDDKEHLNSNDYRDDYYGQEHITLADGRSVSTLGVRQSNRSSSKGRATWDAATSYKINETGTRLKAHAGTAFRSPSLFETHGAFLTSFGNFNVGNPHLSPERSKGYDFGFEQPLFGCVMNIGSTFFRHDLINQIDFVGFGYQNIPGEGHTLGVENFIEVYPWNRIEAKLSHTYTKRLTRGTGMFDIPRNQIAGEVNWKKGKWRIGGSIVYVGSRQVGIFNNDTFLTDTLSEKTYTKVNAGIYYEPRPEIEIYVRVENLLDEKYTESGFRAPGTGVYTGFRTKF